jgi:FkbM family methyltransferase
MNLQAITHYLSPTKILDIGANVGQFHKECKDNFPDSFIFSVEANRDHEGRLKALTNDNYAILLLGDENKTIPFYRNKADWVGSGNSIYKELTDHFRDENLLVTQESMVRLDDQEYLVGAGFDLVKLDTQGSELDIIRGGLSLCKQAKGILIEVSSKPYNQGAPLDDAVIEYMGSIGFHPVATLDENPSTFQKDILFINSFLSRYTFIGDRTGQLQELTTKASVIDIGGQPETSWAKDHATHYVDINLQDSANTFSGSLSLPSVWEKVLAYVKVNGKFDYSVCTHVLEDISNPKLVCDRLGQISKRGFIAVPSKHAEFRRMEGPWRGFIHHRWVFNIEGGRLVAYPKLGFLENLTYDTISSRFNYGSNSELQVFWSDQVDLSLVNNDYLGPDVESVRGYYSRLED